MLCSLLQFLAAPAEAQVAFCGDRLPERSSDMLLPPDASVNDDRRYAVYQDEQEGHPLFLLARRFDEYWPIVSGPPENTLEQDDTLLDELLSLLQLMIWFQGNTRAYNRFWSRDALRDSREWLLVRRLARLSLTRLDWPVTLPATTFADLVHG